MRDKLYNNLSEDDNYTIKDSTTCDWSKFKWNNGYYLHRISTVEIMKPDLISYAYYGTVEYDDIILLLNNIENIFDVIPEQVLYIPKIEDIKSFILENQK